jgi:hypothetical protein
VKAAACIQCVVAGRPSSSPAAASTKAPVQMDTIRPVAAAPVSAAVRSAGSVPSVIWLPPCTPGTTTVSAVASRPRSCPGSTAYPALVVTGPPSTEATRTR